MLVTNDAFYIKFGYVVMVCQIIHEKVPDNPAKMAMILLDQLQRSHHYLR